MAGPPTSRSKPNTIGRKGKFRLAAACADLMSDEDVAWWLREVMAGRDPDAAPRADGTPAPAFVQLPEWKDRIKAAQMFLERRNGKAPQQVTIEDAQQTATAGRTTLSPMQLAALDGAKKAQLRELLREAVHGTRQTLPAEVAAARDANPDDEG